MWRISLTHYGVAVVRAERATGAPKARRAERASAQAEHAGTRCSHRRSADNFTVQRSAPTGHLVASWLRFRSWSQDCSARRTRVVCCTENVDVRKETGFNCVRAFGEFIVAGVPVSEVSKALSGCDEICACGYGFGISTAWPAQTRLHVLIILIFLLFLILLALFVLLRVVR